MTNPVQQKAVQDKITGLFNLVADHYDTPAQRYFPMTGDRIISLLKPAKGSKVLDIACGTGAVTTALAQAILPGGRVQAIDLANNMLDIAWQKISKLGLNNVDLHTMDAAKPDFKSNYFDAAICSFGIFFMPDMTAALKEWQRVLKPGGKLLFTSFADGAFGEPLQILRDDLAAHDILMDSQQVEQVATAEACRALLTQAGYTDAHIDHAQMGMHLATMHDWWEIVTSSGLRGYIEQLPAETLTDFKQAHLARVGRLANDKGIWLDIGVLFAQGIKPRKA